MYSLNNNNMEEKQFDPARVNDQSPAPGMASVDTHNPDEQQQTGERSKSAIRQAQEDKNSDVSQDPNRNNAPNESVAAELNIRSDSPASRDHSKSVEEDVTPRNLEADSDGA
jgi:hypothetical protein